jgi:hypothetical protein
MSTETEQLFESLLTLEGLQSLIGLNESAVLECKTWPVRDDEAQKKILAKALSGFANAAGGVLVLGVDARSQGRDEPDSISELKPIDDRQRVKSRILELSGQLVEPAIRHLRIEDVAASSDGVSGFAVALIPGSDGPPVRSRKDWKFYLRIGSGTYPMEYFQIEAMFGRSARPKLELRLTNVGSAPTAYSGPARWFTLGLYNAGRGIAKFPSIRFKRSSGLSEDAYGIDGLRNFGLPVRPTGGSWCAFQGGANEVIFPDQLVNVAYLRQTSGKLPAYDAVHFEYEISCEGAQTIRATQIVPSGTDYSLSSI